MIDPTQTARSSRRAVKVSKSDNTGESDLVVVFRDGAKSFAILVEDKIDAPVQPEQAQRYRLRADKEILKGEWDCYAVVLCAPQNYIDHCVQACLFDDRVSYEEIGDWLKKEDRSPRGQYRANFVLTSASRRSNGWSRIQDDDTDLFWSAAYDLAAKDFPDLEIKPRALTKGSAWITIRPRDLPTQPKAVYLSLKGHLGLADLTFANTSVAGFAEAVRPLLDKEMIVHATGASAAIRLAIPTFRITDGVEDALPRIRTAYDSSRRLIEFYRANRANLDAAANAATPLAALTGKGK